MIHSTQEEIQRRDDVLTAISSAVTSNTRILLPRDACSTNPYGGSVDPYEYVFEGEDDLLHIAITHKDQSKLTAEEAQSVIAWLLPGMPPGLIWIRPGEYSQHFYCGHDDLVEHVNSKR